MSVLQKKRVNGLTGLVLSLPFISGVQCWMAAKDFYDEVTENPWGQYVEDRPPRDYSSDNFHPISASFVCSKNSKDIKNLLGENSRHATFNEFMAGVIEFPKNVGEVWITAETNKDHFYLQTGSVIDVSKYEKSFDDGGSRSYGGEISDPLWDGIDHCEKPTLALLDRYFFSFTQRGNYQERFEKNQPIRIYHPNGEPETNRIAVFIGGTPDFEIKVWELESRVNE